MFQISRISSENFQIFLRQKSGKFQKKIWKKHCLSYWVCSDQTRFPSLNFKFPQRSRKRSPEMNLMCNSWLDAHELFCINVAFSTLSGRGCHSLFLPGRCYRSNEGFSENPNWNIEISSRSCFRNSLFFGNPVFSGSTISVRLWQISLLLRSENRIRVFNGSRLWHQNISHGGENQSQFPT